MDSPEAQIVPVVVSNPKRSWRGAAAAVRTQKLRYPELSNAEIGRRVGCSTTNVRRILRSFLGKHSETELRQFQESKADVYDSLQLRVLGSVTDAKLRKTPAVSLITGAAILEDKARLVRGQATGINVTALIDVAELMRSRE